MSQLNRIETGLRSEKSFSYQIPSNINYDNILLKVFTQAEYLLDNVECYLTDASKAVFQFSMFRYAARLL